MFVFVFSSIDFCLYLQKVKTANIVLISMLGVQKRSVVQYAEITIVLLEILFQVNYLNVMKYLNFITKPSSVLYYC